MLPNPYDRPTDSPKSLGHKSVSLDVPLKLREPIARICDRACAVVWARMPKAAIHEGDDASLRKYDVGSYTKGASRNQKCLAEAEPSAMELRPKDHLRLGPDLPICSH
jgi:hypothetical protein